MGPGRDLLYFRHEGKSVTVCHLDKCVCVCARARVRARTHAYIGKGSNGVWSYVCYLSNTV